MGGTMFSIGEFSKIAQVSGRLLRYYDELGLFKPAQVDNETGYRFYSAKQLPELNRILALKELGLTLEQIASFSPQISANELRALLVQKKSQIEQTLRAELARLRYIESRIDQIDRDGHLREDDVVVKSVAAQAFLAAHEPSTTLEACRATAEDIGRLALAHFGKKALGHFVVVIHSDLWDTDHLDVEMGYLLHHHPDGDLTFPSGMHMYVQQLPAVSVMATTIHTGIPELGHRGYATLGRWAEANDYHFAGPSREIFLRLPHPGVDDEVVAEIQLPVEKLTAATVPLR
jgi:DNA-binding transcriptional MerR regulator